MLGYRSANERDATHEVVEHIGRKRLRAIGPRMARVVVYLDLKAVGSGGNRGERHGLDIAGVAGGVAGVGDHGKVREVVE